MCLQRKRECTCGFGAAQEYKEKRLVAVDSPGEDAEAETADEEDEKTAKEKEAKPKLVGEQQTELATFVKVHYFSGRKKN